MANTFTEPQPSPLALLLLGHGSDPDSEKGVDCPGDLQDAWFEGRPRVGLTAGASAPDVLVQQVIARLKAMGAVSVRRMQGVEEHVRFPLPTGLGGTGLDRPLPTERSQA